jgi:hypothetical protein
MDKKDSPVEVWRDPIVAEVRQVREALFAEANYDIHEFCRRLSERQAVSGHTIVKREQQLSSHGPNQNLRS